MKNVQKQRDSRVQYPSKIASNFTFGIEIECTVPHSAIRANRVAIGNYHNGIPLPEGYGFPEGGWTAEYDSSIRSNGAQAVEFVSPVLKGLAGLESVKQMVEKIREMGGHINGSCGMHIHVGVKSIAGNNFEKVAAFLGNLLTVTSVSEKALYAMNGERRRERGIYCQTIKTPEYQEAAYHVKAADNGHKWSAFELALYGMNRRRLLNVRNLFNPDRPNTIEFRFGAGTLNWVKIWSYIFVIFGLCELAKQNLPSTKWDRPEQNARAYPEVGHGEAEILRLIDRLAWNPRTWVQHKSDTLQLKGFFHADLRILTKVKNMMIRMAKKYDNISRY